MAKTITITHDGKEFVLEYTRASVRTMERNGFVAQTLESKPMSAVYDLFCGALIARQPDLAKKSNAEFVNQLFDEQDDLIGLVNDLSVMYTDTFNSLADKPGEQKRTKNW